MLLVRLGTYSYKEIIFRRAALRLELCQVYSVALLFGLESPVCVHQVHADLTPLPCHVSLLAYPLEFLSSQQTGHSLRPDQVTLVHIYTLDYT